MVPVESNSAEWILAQFDWADEHFKFPQLGHIFSYLIDARLHVFSDPDRWAMVVDRVGYNPRAANVVDVIYSFGNCLTSGGPGCEGDDFHRRIDNFQEAAIDYDPETPARLDLVVRGHLLSVASEVGEELWDVFRKLVPENRELLLADQSELRGRIPDDLPEILRLDEWHQPPEFLDKRSAGEVYRQLAEVLETGDVARYRTTEPPNSHWTNWRESGTH